MQFHNKLDDRRRRDDDDDRRRPNNRDSNNNNDSRKPPAKETQPEVTVAAPQTKTETKTGGVYIPPFKLAMMQKAMNDKSSIEYQKMTWDALKKSINGLINKVSNISCLFLPNSRSVLVISKI